MLTRDAIRLSALLYNSKKVSTFRKRQQNLLERSKKLPFQVTPVGSRLKDLNKKNLVFNQVFLINVLNDLSEKSEPETFFTIKIKKKKLKGRTKNLIYFFFTKKFFFLKKNWVFLKKNLYNRTKVDKIIPYYKPLFDLGNSLGTQNFLLRCTTNRNFWDEFQFYKDFGFISSNFENLIKFRSGLFSKKYRKNIKKSAQVHPFHEKLFGFLKSFEKKKYNIPNNLINLKLS